MGGLKPINDVRTLGRALFGDDNFTFYREEPRGLFHMKMKANGKTYDADLSLEAAHSILSAITESRGVK